jgi:hypothetical protein
MLVPNNSNDNNRDTMSAPASSASLTIGSADPITAGLTLAGAVVKLTTDELAALNSAQNIAARQAAFEQEQRDLDARAVTQAEEGDATELEERSS